MVEKKFEDESNEQTFSFLPKRTPLALWATPRSSSNAFLRMMVERGDHTVLHEPFEMAYYLGPERCSNRYDQETSILQDTETFDYAIKRINEAKMSSKNPIFIKETPFQLGPLLTQNFFRDYTNAILVRHPAYLVSSLFKVWPDFEAYETGYPGLLQAYRYINSMSDNYNGVPVIDGTDLVKDPEGMVRSFCNAVGIKHIPEALSWKNGDCDAWSYKPMWDCFRLSIKKTTGITKKSEIPFPVVSEREARVIDEMRPLYEEIVANKLQPCSY